MRANILCLGTTPSAQRVMLFRKLVLDSVNRAGTTLDVASGKSINVAKVLKVLGEQPVAVGFVGGARGEFIRAALVRQGIDSEFVTVTAQTRQCITVIDEAAGTHTELVEESQAVEPADGDKLVSILRQRIAGCRAAVMSGTIAPGAPVDLYFQCTRMAEAAGALSVVDAQKAPLLEALKAGPGLVKPNRSELASTMGRELTDEASLMAAMSELGERGAKRVFVTAGKDPALAFDGLNFWRITPPRIKAVNPIGSGDAFTAGLVWRLLRGDDLGESGRWAAAAGAANALTALVGEVDRAEVDRLAREVDIRRI
ncbi:MAG: hexose kinase [Verrucomicrobiia bacterium]